MKLLYMYQFELNLWNFTLGEEILYGTTDGKIGLVEIGELSAATKWEIDNDKKKGGMYRNALFSHEHC